MIVSVAWRGLDFAELQRFSEVSGVQLISLKLGDDSPESVERYRLALRGDLIVIKLAGTDPREAIGWIKSLVGLHEWVEKKALLVLRTQDSHVQSRLEREADADVDFWAISHPGYQSHLPRSKVLLVPVGIEGLSRERALEIAVEDWPLNELDVVCLMNAYVASERNYQAFLLSRALRRADLSAFFGTIKPVPGSDAGVVYRGLRKASLSINLPMRADLNMRNFETALAGVPCLTHKVPGHELFPELSNLRFLPEKGNLLDETLGLLNESRQTISNDLPRLVACNHLSNDRLYEIIWKLFGMNLKPSNSPLNSQHSSATGEAMRAITKAHSELKLLVLSPVLPGTSGARPIESVGTAERLLTWASYPLRLVLTTFSIVRKRYQSALVALRS